MRSIQRAFVILFVLGISLAASARAQQSPVSQSELNDAQEWARHIHQTVPADELAAAAMTAELRQSDDPLLTLAAKYHLDAPDWLGNRIQAQAASVTLAALGDSISAGMASCASPYYYCPGNSWSTGDLPTSLRRELETSSGREVHGLLVSVPSLSMSAVPAEAFVVFLASFFGLNIERMTLLIGHNDPGVCGAPVEGQTAAFEKSYATALRILAHVARNRRAKLFVSGIVDATTLPRYAAVIPAGASQTCRELWDATGRCKVLLSHLDDPSVAARITAQITEYDDSLSRLAAGKEWVLYTPTLTNSSREGFPDPVADLSPFDCFHPSAIGQAHLGRIAWSGDAGGAGIAPFFGLELAAAAPRSAALSAPGLAPRLQKELEVWRAADTRP